MRRGQRRLSGVFITNTDSPRFLSVQVPLDVKAGLGQQPIPPNSSKGLFDVVSQIREIRMLQSHKQFWGKTRLFARLCGSGGLSGSSEADTGDAYTKEHGRAQKHASRTLKSLSFSHVVK